MRRKFLNYFLPSYFLRNLISMESLHFDNRALQRLPIDEEKRNYVRSVKNACFSRVTPTPVENPTLVCASQPALELLNITPAESNKDDFKECFAGNKILCGSEPASHCYTGFQFGLFSGQLGDGAAIYLGEVLNKAGERWEVQLKGAGLTPFSRTADGRKVLRSSLREFLASEALYHLNVPTTRAGAVITSDTFVVRDLFYDGHPRKERCSIVLRIAESFIRFGSFQICLPPNSETGRAGPSKDNPEILNKLIDYVIETFYPDIWIFYNGTSRSRMIAAWLIEVVQRTAILAAKWQSIGFVHGVLNTDNMSILGLTIDYGPYGFIDFYDPDFVCNTSDNGGRYSLSMQPSICLWNCRKLVEALKDHISEAEQDEILAVYEPTYQENMLLLWRAKLGLNVPLENDQDLIQALLDTMSRTAADFTNVFRKLSNMPHKSDASFEPSLDSFMKSIVDECLSLEELRKHLKPPFNPAVWMNMLQLERVMPQALDEYLRGGNAFQATKRRVAWAEEMVDWDEIRKRDENSTLWRKWLLVYSDRLTEETGSPDERRRQMNSVNPAFLLRNYIAQEAIEAAEKGDFEPVHAILNRLERPFDEPQGDERFCKRAPDGAAGIRLS